MPDDGSCGTGTVTGQLDRLLRPKSVALYGGGWAENVIAQLNNIKTHPSVAVGLRDSTLRLHGWFYDIESGDIRALDKNSKTFVSLSENTDVYFE